MFHSQDRSSSARLNDKEPGQVRSTLNFPAPHRGAREWGAKPPPMPAPSQKNMFQRWGMLFPTGSSAASSSWLPAGICIVAAVAFCWLGLVAHTQWRHAAALEVQLANEHRAADLEGARALALESVAANASESSQARVSELTAEFEQSEQNAAAALSQAKQNSAAELARAKQGFDEALLRTNREWSASAGKTLALSKRLQMRLKDAEEQNKVYLERLSTQGADVNKIKETALGTISKLSKELSEKKQMLEVSNNKISELSEQVKSDEEQIQKLSGQVGDQQQSVVDNEQRVHTKNDLVSMLEKELAQQRISTMNLEHAASQGKDSAAMLKQKLDEKTKYSEKLRGLLFEQSKLSLAEKKLVDGLKASLTAKTSESEQEQNEISHLQKVLLHESEEGKRLQAELMKANETTQAQVAKETQLQSAELKRLKMQLSKERNTTHELDSFKAKAYDLTQSLDAEKAALEKAQQELAESRSGSAEMAERLGKERQKQVQANLQVADYQRQLRQEQESRRKMQAVFKALEKGDGSILAEAASPASDETESSSQNYVVTNDWLHAPTEELAFRRSKLPTDKDLSRPGAQWGSVVTGRDQGDGWVKVGSEYLPIEINGKAVLKVASPRKRFSSPPVDVSKDGVA